MCVFGNGKNENWQAGERIWGTHGAQTRNGVTIPEVE